MPRLQVMKFKPGRRSVCPASCQAVAEKTYGPYGSQLARRARRNASASASCWLFELVYPQRFFFSAHVVFTGKPEEHFLFDLGGGAAQKRCHLSMQPIARTFGAWAAR